MMMWNICSKLAYVNSLHAKNREHHQKYFPSSRILNFPTGIVNVLKHGLLLIYHLKWH